MNVLARLIPWQIWAAAGAAILLTVSAWAINHRAYNRGFAASEAAVAARVAIEVRRQIEANAAAVLAAEETIRELERQKEQRDATIERLLAEARADPDAGQPSLDPSSVRRLNQVR